jgi:type I restriction enzyme S subunit
MDGIFNGPRFSRDYVLDAAHGVPFLGSTDILHADLSFAPLLAKRQVLAQPELVIEKWWTLISCSGTIGRMAFSRQDMKGMAGSQHFMRVIADPDEVLPGYLHAYLSSRFGVPLVVSGTYGSVIQHIEPHQLANLPVPRLGERLERQVHEKVIEAATLLTEYQQQVRSATDALFESVGLKDITSGSWHSGNPDLGFARKLESPTSLRALNFNPRFQELCDSIRTKSWKPLLELCKPGTLRRSGRYKRIEAEPEYSYRLIGQKEIFWVRPAGRWIARKSVGADVLVEPGTTLVAAQGTFGESELYCRAEFVWGPALATAYSEHLLRVVSDEDTMPRGCMFAFMRSETAFRMLRSASMGTKLQDHHPSFLNDLPIPYPPKPRRAEIHELVVDAYEKRYRSVSLEDEAVALVEAAVEGGN